MRLADGWIINEIERRQLAVYPQVGGGWVVFDSVPTGGGDYSEVELARGRDSWRDVVGRALAALDSTINMPAERETSR